MPHPAHAGLAVADILRDHAAPRRDVESRAVAHLLACRTVACGLHVYRCDTCGAHKLLPNSCRDRHCPRCGSLDQALWAEAQLPHLLPVPYFHLVFTIPASLRPFFDTSDRRAALEALMRAAADTLIGMSAQRIHATPGILLVLHTWTQRLELHPHVHCLVTGGGLAADGHWVLRRAFFLGFRALRRVFKSKLLEALEALHRDHRSGLAAASGHELLRDARSRVWNLEVRKPLGGPEQVVRYFARYTRRIAISDSRLVAYDGQTVTFRYRDRRDGNRVKTLPLPAPVFARRFLTHVLPPHFVRIRRAGILANRGRAASLDRAREALATPPPPAAPKETRFAACERIFGKDPRQCPRCKLGKMVLVRTYEATEVPLDLVLATVYGATLGPAPTRAP